MLFAFLLVLIICMVQAQKGIDLSGYLWHVSQALQGELLHPPYPTQEAHNGDYFQSPITTLFLIPFTFVPLSVAKGVFALIYSIGLVFFLKSLNIKNLPTKAQFILLLFFVHALSDVFLSLNFLFPVALLLWLSHQWSLSKQLAHQAASGFAFFLALALRPFPALLIPFFIVSKKKRGVVPWIFLFGFLGLAFTLFVFPSPIDWWKNWLSSLGLYSEAAYVLAPTFQTPLSNLDRIAHYVFNFPITNLGWVELLGGLFYLVPSYFLAFHLENRGRSMAAFSILLSLLYCCFSRIWASGFLYCLPLLLYGLRISPKVLFVMAICYALTPKWAWPTDIWAYWMGVIGIQGWLITAAIAYSWTSIYISTRGKNNKSLPSHISHFGEN